MPPIRIPQRSAPIVPVPVIPIPADLPSSGGNSAAGAPMRVGGAPSQGFIRVTQPRIPASSAPTRPGAEAGNSETRAAGAAKAGQSDAAIRNLTAAINADSRDAGYRYQQRATLFLERGDYTRATDDFQSAISAYNQQIQRGESVSLAQSGLRTSRRGLAVALASARRSR